VARLGPAVTTADFDDAQGPALAARVAQDDGVAVRERRQPRLRQAQHGGRRVRRRLRGRGRRQPDACRAQHAPAGVAQWLPARHRRSCRDRTSAQFGSAEVHQNAAVALQFALGGTQVHDHPLPRLGIVVGAVDAHAVHAVAQELEHQTRVARGFARHGHHDATGTVWRWIAEQSSGAIAQQRRTVPECGQPRIVAQRGPCPPAQPFEDPAHGLEVAQNVRLRTPQRRQPESLQSLL